MMTGILVDEEACTGCGNCESACSFGGITIVEDKATITDNCQLCGACIDECPFDAITIDRGEVARKDLEEYRGVWIFAEQQEGMILPVAFQLLAKGKELASKLNVKTTAVVFGELANGQIDELGFGGADEILHLDDHAFSAFSTELYVDALSSLVRERKPEIVLVGATPVGRDFAPRVSKRVDAGLTADCTGLEIEEGSKHLLQTRPTFGGNVMATIKTPSSRPQMATVRPNTFKPERGTTASAKVTKIEYDAGRVDLAVKTITTIKKQREKQDIQDASIIVSGGRGVGCKEDFAHVENLAEALGGAVAGSRMSCELDWIEHEHQVGQTGKTVAPDLYIACGISGAIQHKVGMQGSGVIVAINKDPAAPIFDVAHVGVVADIKVFLPLLVEEIRKIKESSS